MSFLSLLSSDDAGVETTVGDPSKEVERLEAVAKQREEAEEEADYRAVERGHVSATLAGRVRGRRCNRVNTATLVCEVFQGCSYVDD